MSAAEIPRRTFLAGGAAAAGAALFPGAAAASTHGRGSAAAAPPADVALHWLDGTAAPGPAATWGVPWPKGLISDCARLALTDAAGTAVAVQSWPLAYWPDRSIKWSGHAIGAGRHSESYSLAPGAPAAPSQPVTATHSGSDVILDNGVISVRLAGAGPIAIRSIARTGRTTAHDGRLVLLLQDAPDAEDGHEPRRTSWTGVVSGIEVEQSGPVRAVVKLSGRYLEDRGPRFGDEGGGRRGILPWTMRIYLGAADESIRLVHNFLWDADETRDFVKGLGLTLSVPMPDEAHNRHIRLGGAQGGVWGEPVRVLTGLRRDPGAAVRAAQVAGTATPPVSQWAATVAAGYTQLALWNDFTLFQESADHFAIWKRTSAAGSWLKHAGKGARASGFGYVGGISGGLGFGLRDFWQRFPRSLDVRGAAGDTATATLWSWSPHAAAMDLRHYDTTAHGLDLSYEDVQPGFSTPLGMARSTEMRLWAFDSTPSRDTIAALGPALTAPPQLVADPAWYHGAKVFGRWGLIDRSTPARARLEDSIVHDVAFYAAEVDQRGWYGFWHYGDVMHTYDADRHVWRYDVGGYAWDNAELGSDAMLWYAFLRSGDPVAFRLAHAMTQHVSEVDVHHTGRFAGLGSRHNVSHWGDGAKEARVGESYTKRFSYYLTADELLGDLIRTSLQADETLVSIDPLREVLPPQTLAPARVRIGPDWYALVSNWLTEWERTGDPRWRDRITTGMADIATFPAGLFTGEAGGAVGFDPATGHLVNFNKGDFTGGYNLSMAFLGEQILWETLDLVDVPTFRQTYLDFARYVQAPAAEQIAHYGFSFNPQVFKTIYSRMTAWAGEQLGDPAIRQRGWQQLLTDPAGRPWPTAVTVGGDAVIEPVSEIPVASVADGTVATNDASQRSLAIIALLDIASQEAP
ncbi:MAG TPA: hypothetical protein VFU74_00525 [Actinocrinis sp.]|nr:hypothetical protein [Actinocrinis sp.]